MTRVIAGFHWPADVGEKWRHSLRHVKSLEWAIEHCERRRTAVQAGGNIGLWPWRMAQTFERVFTFEPDAVSRLCLKRNVPGNVRVFPNAVGQSLGVCGIQRESLGSHRVTDGTHIPVTTVDALELQDVDLLQLDIEGYEWHALKGSEQTIERSHPTIQVELRGFTAQYGKADTDVLALLRSWGYSEVSRQPGNDVVFQWRH